MFLERCYLLRTPPAELRQKKIKKLDQTTKNLSRAIQKTACC